MLIYAIIMLKLATCILMKPGEKYHALRCTLFYNIHGHAVLELVVHVVHRLLASMDAVSVQSAMLSELDLTMSVFVCLLAMHVFPCPLAGGQSQSVPPYLVLEVNCTLVLKFCAKS